jgi:glucose-1-phosphate thymidylyltransferase
MKGLILSGGKGTRLYPITFNRAKQLVPVANKPVLFRVIEAIKEAGINDIGIVIGDTGAEIREAVGHGRRWGVNITYIPQEAPLGLAHAVKISQDFLGDERFVMFLGDNVIQGGISGLIRQFASSAWNSQVVLTAVDQPQHYGVAELDEQGKIKRLVEKPRNPPSNLALVGIYMFDHNIFTAVNSIKPSWRGELEITDAIQWLVENGYAVHPYVHRGWWIDTGKPIDMLEANNRVLAEIEHKIEGYVDRDSKGRPPGHHRARRRDHQQRHPRPGDHRRGCTHRQQLRRPLHQHLPPHTGRRQRDRAQYRARSQPHRRHPQPYWGQHYRA